MTFSDWLVVPLSADRKKGGSDNRTYVLDHPGGEAGIRLM